MIDQMTEKYVNVNVALLLLLLLLRPRATAARPRAAPPTSTPRTPTNSPPSLPPLSSPLRYKDKPALTYQQMNVCSLEFPDETFDAVVAKGTMDAILCGEGSTANVAKMCMEVSRVLRPNGVFFIVSYGVPENRLQYLEPEDYSWNVTFHTVPKVRRSRRSVGTAPPRLAAARTTHRPPLPSPPSAPPPSPTPRTQTPSTISTCAPRAAPRTKARAVSPGVGRPLCVGRC